MKVLYLRLYKVWLKSTSGALAGRLWLGHWGMEATEGGEVPAEALLRPC